jgi:hypothetical protein
VDIAAKAAADIALMDSIKKRVILKNNGAFPKGQALALAFFVLSPRAQSRGFSNNKKELKQLLHP